MNNQLPVFQEFLYANIPLVKSMQLNLTAISSNSLSATAPLNPNINDKKTVFGGSSAALMTVCGWSLIKIHLEQQGFTNDVVIHQAETAWVKAQFDDLNIQVYSQETINWQSIEQQLQNNKRNVKIKLRCQVVNQQAEICCSMLGSYVILNKQNT